MLGATGAIAWFARLVPQSVVTGLQLGLGITLALLSLELMAGLPWLGLVTIALLLLMLRVPRCPATLVALAAAVVLAQLAGVGAALAAVRLGAGLAARSCCPAPATSDTRSAAPCCRSCRSR